MTMGFAQLAGRAYSLRLGRYCGQSLVELMVALAVSSLLLLAAVKIMMEGRSAFRSSESLVQLQEAARYALAALQFDIQQAGYWGLTRDASPTSQPIVVASDCGPGWATDLQHAVDGHNNRYGLNCSAYANRPAPAADTLVIRRAAFEQSMTLDSGRLFVASSHTGAARLIVGGTDGSPAAADAQWRELVVHGYYVSDTSSLSTPGQRIPSLRVKTLVGGGLGPRIIDQEVFPGVEDMQIEFGIDSSERGQPGFGSVDRYVAPQAPVLVPGSPSYTRTARILTVRVWLRLRSLQRDTGYRSNRPFDYADQHFVPPPDQLRRELVSATFYIRNS